MTALEVQTRMAQIFEELKTLEVKLQVTQADINKALTTERTTSEGLVEVKKRLKDCKSTDLVEIAKFVANKKDVETVERFLDQAKSHRMILEATHTTFLKTQNAYQDAYDKLGTVLEKLGTNILDFPGS